LTNIWGDWDIDEALAPIEDVNGFLGYDETFIKRHAEVGELLEARVRKGTFVECKLPLTPEQARKEGGRCLRCQLRLQLKPALQPPVKQKEPAAGLAQHTSIFPHRQAGKVFRQ